MILESVTLENIRSYIDSTTIKLPSGSTLFEGDIGSGKSSILSAIEFALFGLGDIDGRYLLNSRSKRGSVLLEFQVDQRRYKVHRELLRNKKSVVQGAGYIVEGTAKTEYAVTGMRARILDIIGIKERQQTKTTSLIYRSAIFSPQEMMKEILTENTERRLDTLRRAFGIEDYSNAKKNGDVIDGWASSETRVSAGLSKDLPQMRQTLSKEEANLARLSSESDPLASKLKAVEQGIGLAEEKMAAFKEQRDHVLQLEASIPSLQSRVGDTKGGLAEERRRLSKLKEDLSELEKAERRLGELGQRYAQYVQEKQELDSLEPLSDEYSKKENDRQRLKASLSEKTLRLQQEVDGLRVETQREQNDLQAELKELEPLQKLKTRVIDLEKTVAEIKKVRRKSEELRTATDKLKLERQPLQSQIKAAKDEMDGIVAIGAGAPCPKCRRPLDEGHLRQLKARFKTEVGAKRKQVAALQTRLSKLTLETKAVEMKLAGLIKDEHELRQLEPKVSALDAKAGSTRKAESRLDARNEKLKDLEETLRKKDFAQAERTQLESLEKLLEEQGPVAARFKELKKKVQAAEKDQIHSIYLNAAEKVRRKPQLEEEVKIGEQRVASSAESLLKQERELEERKDEYAEKKPMLKELTSLVEERAKLGKEHDETTKKLVTVTANLDNTRERIKMVGEEVKRMERSNRRRVYFEQIRAWLDTCFIPAVEDIERNTLTTVNETFNQEFQKWFRILIETEDMEVEVDQSFTPIVTQGGYSLDVNSLSGGERTSVALAYRLALNVTARAAIGLQPDLLILDEPTDGFSSVQLTKLSQVLDGLRTAQVIMVSHERELETYVNHICKVTKVGGVSRVQFEGE